MCNPAKQDFHSLERYDDEGISDSDRLLRHLCIPIQINETKFGLKISDQAFKPRKSDPGTSVDLECMLHHDGLTERDRRGIMPNSYGLVAVSALVARSHSNGVAWTPKPEEPELGEFASKPNKYHGEIIGPIAKSDFRNIAANSAILWTRIEMDLGPYIDQNPDLGT